MIGHLNISFTTGEGAVLRMLGLVERRGFLVRRITMTENGEDATLAIDLEPCDAGRSLEVMARQLARLVDVRSVTVSPLHAGQSA